MMNQKRGFTLVELMVVIAIIAILAAVAVPAYSNYVTRSKITSEIEKLGSIKVQASEYASNNNDSFAYTQNDFGDLPNGASIGDNGAIVLDTSDVVANSSVSLVPSISSGAIVWSCSTSGLSDSQVPSICGNGEASSSDSGSSQSNQASSNISSGLYQGVGCEAEFSCYAPNEDTTMQANAESVEITTYPGAGESEAGVGVDSLTLNMNSENKGVFSSMTASGPGPDFASIDDINNSNLSETDKQNAIEGINAIKQTAYCDGVNSDVWVCQ